MAFQTGTQVRPELGRADVGGFAKGGAAIGAGILQGIENYREQKQITASALADLEGRFAANPSLLATASQAGGNIGKSFKKVFKEGDFNQRDVLNLSGYVNSLQSTQAAEQQSRLRKAQIDKLEAEIGPDGAKLTEAESEIRRVMKANPNLSYTDAVNIKEGVSKIVTNPVTGRTVIANLATGEEKPLTRSKVTDAAVSASLAPDEGASESSLNLYKIAETTTGIVPAIQAATQRITGQVGIDVADPELLENIQTFQTAQSDIRRSMRTAPKFLASEMAMLDKELDIAPSAFKDPTTLLAQLRSVDKSIRNRLEGIAKSINDPNLPADEVSAGLRLQKDLINFLRNLNVPQAEQVDTEELYRQAGGTVDVSSIADKYLNQ
jgi:hypothetical protein